MDVRTGLHGFNTPGRRDHQPAIATGTSGDSLFAVAVAPEQITPLNFAALLA
jgi:hypothetical protein